MIPRCDLPEDLLALEAEAERRKRESINALIRELGGVPPKGDEFGARLLDLIEADKQALKARGRR